MNIVCFSWRDVTYLADYDVMSLLVLKLKRLKVVVKGWENQDINKITKFLKDIDRDIQELFASCLLGIFTKDGALRLLSLKL